MNSGKQMLSRRAAIKAVGVVSVVARTAKADTGPIADTVGGKVAGYALPGVEVFKGIPYGAPTSGKGRFLPPKKAEPWIGVRDCVAFGSTAPQASPDSWTHAPRPPRQSSPDFPLSIYRTWFAGSRPPPASEDCLNLNIWTPGRQAGAKRPVMVWLHAGGFISGNATNATTDGSNLARKGVVVVSLHHRLNILGAMQLTQAGGSQFEGSGQAGMLDVVLALEWIRDNIANFGGDPGNVTLFGESGGGMKQAALMAMPAAKGLFHKAIMESGPWIRFQPKDDGENFAMAIMAELQIARKDVAKLQEIPRNDLLSATYKVLLTKKPRPAKYDDLAGFAQNLAPIVDGVHIAEDPFRLAPTAIANDVALIIGTNITEWSIFGTPELFNLDEPGLLRRAEDFFGEPELARKAVEAYRSAWPGASPTRIQFLMASDRAMRVPSVHIAELKAAQRAPVYSYRFDWEVPIQGGILGAPHTAEVPFVFNNLREAANKAVTGDDPRTLALSDHMAESWLAFAHTGDPSTSALGRWPKFSPQARSTMLFNKESRVVTDPNRAERELVAGVLAPLWTLPRID